MRWTRVHHKNYDINSNMLINKIIYRGKKTKAKPY